MIVRTLQALSVISLISACIVFTLCVVQWREGNAVIESNQELHIAEKFKQLNASNQKSNNNTRSPLVEQAEAFALYLNPPKPKEALVVRSNKKKTVSAVKVVKSTPKFTLVATSYYSSNPEESMALVSEPGSGYRWVKQGQRLGHFVVESIERGLIMYRNGDQLLEVAVNTDIPAIKEQAGQTTLASNQTNTALFTTSDIQKRNTIAQKTVQTSIPKRVETQPTVNRREATQTRKSIMASVQINPSHQKQPSSQRARTIKHKTTFRPDPVQPKTQQTVYDRRRNRT